MYLDPAALSGALRLLQLLLNPFLSAGLQSAAYPNSGLSPPPAYGSLAAPVVTPPRQLSSNDLFAQLAAPPAGAMAITPSSGTLMPGSMTVASASPYAPWLFSPPLPAVANAPNGPVYVPPSAGAALLPGGQPTQGQASAASLAAILEQAIAPYTNGASSPASSSSSSSSSSSGADEVGSPMPMATLLSTLNSVAAGIRVVVVNFAASVAVMGAARIVRLIAENLPIILNLLGLTRASMARVIVDGVTRAQCLERAACVMGQHAATYRATPEVLRWLRSPDPAAPTAHEHPVWTAFRLAAEGGLLQCDVFAC